MGHTADQPEDIVWIGKPNPLQYSIYYGKKVFMLGIPFTVFSIFWIIQATSIMQFDSKDFFQFNNLFPFIGLFFVLVGLKMLSEPLKQYYIAKKTIYFVTNKRACILKNSSKHEINSFSKNNLSNLNISRNANGGGDIIFRVDQHTNFQGMQITTNVGFIGLKDVQIAEKAFEKIENC